MKAAARKDLANSSVEMKTVTQVRVVHVVREVCLGSDTSPASIQGRCKEGKTRRTTSRWTKDDDEALAARLVYGTLDFVSDTEMTEKLKGFGLSGQSYPAGTPDAALLTEFTRTSIRGELMQVTRAYNKDHLHAMIAEKVLKSQIFLNTVSGFGIKLDISRFVIAVFVPAHLDSKARRIEAAANIALVHTVFVFRILSAGEEEDRMFKYLPRKEQLMGSRKRLKKVPECVLASLEEAGEKSDYIDIVDDLWCDTMRLLYWCE